MFSLFDSLDQVLDGSSKEKLKKFLTLASVSKHEGGRRIEIEMVASGKFSALVQISQDQFQEIFSFQGLR